MIRGMVHRWAVRRDLRSLAAYRRRIRACARDAEARYRAGYYDDAGRELAALAILLDQCDRDIDRALDEYDTLTR